MLDKNAIKIKYPNNLFHGSSLLIAENLDLEKSQEGLTYASDDFDYAAFLAILNLDEGGNAGVTYSKEGNILPYISSGFVNGNSSLKKGYVYVLDKEGFEDVEGHEWVSKDEHIKIIDTIEVTPEYFDGKIFIKG